MTIPNTENAPHMPDDQPQHTPVQTRANTPDGDPARHLAIADLEHSLASLNAPQTHGRLELIVIRNEHHQRTTPPTARLTRQRGLHGDAWERDHPDNPDAQLTLMRADVGRLIANGQPLSLFGDNLLVHLDLSQNNLPPGTQLRIGQATLQITPKPHRGCAKYAQRFGPDALRLTANPRHAHLHLRGVYARVITDGQITLGDPIHVIPS